MAAKKAIFTSNELCERYGVVLRTIQSWQRKKGFPMGDFISKTYRFTYDGVINWEKIHMPHLHAESSVDEDPAQKAEWDRRARRHAIDRDLGKEVEEKQKPQRPKKAKRPASRKK